MQKSFQTGFYGNFRSKNMDKKNFALVGFTGGADSVFTLDFCKKLGLNPLCVYLNYPRYMNQLKSVLLLAKKFKVNLDIIDISEDYFTGLIKQLKSNKKPCSFCMEYKLNLLKNYAIKKSIPFLILGSVYSDKGPVEIEKKLVIIHLPYLLNMGEKEVVREVRKIINKGVVYGCPVPEIIKNNHITINKKLKQFWLKKLKNWGGNLNKKWLREQEERLSTY